MKKEASKEGKKDIEAEWAKYFTTEELAISLTSAKTVDGSIFLPMIIIGSELKDQETILETYDGEINSSLLKLNSDGILEWIKSFEAEFNAMITVRETSDGGFIATGVYGSSNAVDIGNNLIMPANEDISGYLIKYNANFEPEWLKTYNDVILTTDIIVGFPGETDEEFQNCYNFLKDTIKPAFIHVFPYSRRANTPAAEMPDQVPEDVKKKRDKI